MLSSMSFDSVIVALYLVISAIVGKKKQISIMQQIISFIFFAYFLVVSTKVIPLGVFVILIIEASQLVLSYLYGFTYRIFDVDDIILNTIGLLIGVILYRAFIRVSRKSGFKIPLR